MRVFKTKLFSRRAKEMGLAEFFLGCSDNEIDNAVKTGDLIEVYDEQA